MRTSMIGSKIGSYEIVEQLGQGTSTVSFLARDAKGKVAVAKRLFDWLASQDEISKKFLAATGLSAKIRMRKNLAVVSSEMKLASGIFLVRQYVEGQPLSQLIQQGRLGELDKRRFALSLCDAVRAMGSRDVVHGGIHPGNVIVQPDGHARVTDFSVGLASLCGKPDDSYPLEPLRYLAPEQWRGEEIDFRADVYSAGLIITMVDQGKEVFDARDRASLEAQILAGYKVDCPILAAAIAPNPKRRYPLLDKFRSSLRTKYVPPEPPPEPPPKPPKKREKRPQQKKESPTGTAPPEKKVGKGKGAVTIKDGTRAGPAMPPPRPAGFLTDAYDVEADNQNLLASDPPEVWEIPKFNGTEQRPLQLRNGGPGWLRLSVSCSGSGISVSPDSVDIAPGQISPVIVTLQSDLGEWSRLSFKWEQNKTPMSREVRLHRAK
jgi:serine/threonine protein kinase